VGLIWASTECEAVRVERRVRPIVRYIRYVRSVTSACHHLKSAARKGLRVQAPSPALRGIVRRSATSACRRSAPPHFTEVLSKS